MGYHSLLLSSHLRRPILATGILLRMPKQLARHGIVRAARGEMATLYLLTSREEVRRQPQPPRRRASRRHPSTMKDRVSCRRHHRHHRLRCRVSCRRVSHLLTHTQGQFACATTPAWCHGIAGDRRIPPAFSRAQSTSADARWCWPPSGAGHQTAATTTTTAAAEMAAATDEKIAKG